MSDLERQQELTSLVFTTLKSLKTQKERELFRSLFNIYAGLPEGRSVKNVGLESIPTKTGKGRGGSRKGTTSKTQPGGEKKGVTAKPSDGPVNGTVSLSKIREYKSNIVKTLLLKELAVKRQQGADTPAMNHKAIRARISKCRKTLRKCVAEFKDSDQSDLASFRMLNATSALKLQLSDAVKKHLDLIMIGDDLHRNYPEPELVLAKYKSLLQLGLVKDEDSGFLTDPATIFKLPAAKAKQEITNPFGWSKA